MPAKKVFAEGYVSPPEAATILGMSLSNLAILRRKKRGPLFQKFGAAVMYSKTDLAAYSKVRKEIETLKAKL